MAKPIGSGYGAVWLRQSLDAFHRAAESAGASVSFQSTARPIIEDDVVRGSSRMRRRNTRVYAEKVIVATGAPGAVARDSAQSVSPMNHLALQFEVMSSRQGMPMTSWRRASHSMNTEHPCPDTAGCFSWRRLSEYRCWSFVDDEGLQSLNLNSSLASYRATVESMESWSRHRKGLCMAVANVGGEAFRTRLDGRRRCCRTR